MAQLTKSILSIYGVLAAYSLGYFSYRNGFIDLVSEASQEWLDPQTHLLKGPPTTGIPSLDNTLASLLVFYTPVLDGNFPGLSLLFLNCFGMITLSLVLVALESLRQGNRTL